MSDALLDDEGIPEEVDDEFLAKLEAVADAEQRIANLTAELDRIDIGLDEEDTRRLLWAHLTGWLLSDISETFEASRTSSGVTRVISPSACLRNCRTTLGRTCVTS